MKLTGLEDELSRADGIILFDGDCGFCRRMVRHLLRLCDHKRLLICSVRSARGALAAEALGERPSETFAFLTADRAATGVKAYAEILALSPRTAWVGRMFEKAPPVLSDSLYRWVGSHRSLMTRIWGAAARSDPELSTRYVAGGE